MYVWERLCFCAYMSVCVCIYVCVYEQMYLVNMYVCVLLWVYMYVVVCVNMCECVCVCDHVCCLWIASFVGTFLVRMWIKNRRTFVMIKVRPTSSRKCLLFTRSPYKSWIPASVCACVAIIIKALNATSLQCCSLIVVSCCPCARMVALLSSTPHHQDCEAAAVHRRRSLPVPSPSPRLHPAESYGDAFTFERLHNFLFFRPYLVFLWNGLIVAALWVHIT